MPKKSKGSKSKRMTLSKKYKIKKKVKEHHRKQSKAQRKAGGSKKKVAPKDPGIPAQWPFKEELLKELAWEKQRMQADDKARKEARRTAQAAAAAGLHPGAAQPHMSDGSGSEPEADDEMAEVPAEGASMEQVQREVQQKQAAFEAAQGAQVPGKGPSGDRGAVSQKAIINNTLLPADGTRKAFYREFMKVVEAADVVIEVLDARDPLACRCTDVERIVRRSGSDKKVILLLNKIDLVPRKVAEKWLAYLREELPTVAFKCSTQQQASHLSHKRLPVGAAPEGALQTSECLGAEALLQLLKNYSRNADVKTAITVGVVGLPNVGKSSLINSLKRSRAAQVGNTPGVTKTVQEVVLDKHVRLLDSPGIVFSGAGAGTEGASALRNCIKVDQLEDPTAPVAEIVQRCPAQQLMTVYNIPAFAGAEEFLQRVAAARGKLQRGGTADVVAAARLVLHDWNDGRIPFYTLPPARGSQEGHAAAELVPSWATDFDADEAFRHQTSAVIAGLPSLEEATTAHFQMQSAGPVSMEESDSQAAAVPQLQSADVAEAMGTGDKPELRNKGMQDEMLYSEPGQFNPRAARAAKKRQKKQKC